MNQARLDTTIVISPCFDAGRSLLGRLFRAITADERQAESYLILAVGLLGLAVLLGGYLGWALVPPGSRHVFVAVFLGLVFLMGAGLTGRRPSVTVRAGQDELTIDSADGELRIPYSAVERWSRIDDRTFHRHYRRYAETRVFVNRVPSELLLLRAGDAPVVLGLETEADRTALEALLAETADARRASSRVGVA